MTESLFYAHRTQSHIVRLVFSLFLFLSAATPASQTGDYIHYRLGVKYKNENKHEAAIEEFRKVLSAYPDNYNAYMHMAEIRMTQNRYRLVVYNLKKALSYNPGWGKAHKLLAQAYENDGQIQKAIIELQNYQQSCDPAERDSLQNQIDRMVKIAGVSESPSAQMDLRETALNIKNTQSAESTQKQGTADPAREGKPFEPDNRRPSETNDSALDKVIDLYENGKHDDALVEIRNLLKGKPNHAGAYYYAGLIRNARGQYQMAKVNFLKAVNFPELGYNSHFYLGKILADEKKTSEAIAHLNSYLQKSTYEPGKKEAQERIDQLKKMPDDAGAKKAQKVKTAAKDNLSTLHVPGKLPSVEPLAHEKYTILEVRIDSLLSMMTVDTLTDLGQKLLSGIHEFTNGNYDASIREFKKVMVSYPDGIAPLHCLYNTGVCYFKLNLLKEAENQFQQVLDRYPKHQVAAQSLFLKALTYLQRDEPQTAETLFRTFIQNNREHEWVGKAYEKLGECYEEMEQPKKAIDAYQQASLKGKNSDRVFAYFKTGTLYLQIGNSTRAHEAFKSAIDLGEKHDIYYRVPDSYYRIADEKYKAKDFQGAMEYYTKVTRKYPAFQETPWGLFQIGSIYKNLNRYQDALDTYKNLVRKYPDDYWAKQAKWKMEDAIWENEYRAVLK
ncbi:MAG: tetratricopeptide repeat protein [Fibrobacter sp.]|nr:tetratricopeptide repeat protein [Fibrobacter sp.]